jgi:hypothetical protein
MAQWEKDYGYDEPDYEVGSCIPLTNTDYPVDNARICNNDVSVTSANWGVKRSPLEQAGVDYAVACLELALAEKRKEDALKAYAAAATQADDARDDLHDAVIAEAESE